AMPALGILIALFMVEIVAAGGWLARMATLVALGLFVAVGWGIHEEPQSLRKLMTYKYDRPMPQHLPIDPVAPVSSTPGTTTWEDSWFYKETSDTLQAILSADFLEYETFIRFL